MLKNGHFIVSLFVVIKESGQFGSQVFLVSARSVDLFFQYFGLHEAY